MIKTKEEMKQEIKERLRDGNGALTLTHLFDKGDTYEKCNLCAVIDFKPGTSIGEHPHDPDAELYYILEGELAVVDNGVKKILNPGDAVFTGGGNRHSVSNDSGRPAKLLAVVIR